MAIDKRNNLTSKAFRLPTKSVVFVAISLSEKQETDALRFVTARRSSCDRWNRKETTLDDDSPNCRRNATVSRKDFE